MVRPKKIIHCDADCFYAAIEIRDDPSLRDRPVAVGGSADRRGVLTTCNYEARRYGVRSAMPSAQAKRLCPDLIIVKGNMAKYKEASAVMRAVFEEYTTLVEPLSLDEAYLDVSDCEQFQGSATLIAQDIRRKIYERLRITVSAGVAPNKFLAKIASDWNKPNGLKVITPDQVATFVESLPVRKIHGVGKVTAEKLARHGIRNCKDVQDWGELALCKHFGSFGQHLWDLSHGKDSRQVIAERTRKSLSVENTYSQDLTGYDQCAEQVPALLTELNIRLGRLDKGYVAAKAFIKIKFNDFTQTTVERVDASACLEDCLSMLEEGLARQVGKNVRLLGVGVRFVLPGNGHRYKQLDMFDDVVSVNG